MLSRKVCSKCYADHYSSQFPPNYVVWEKQWVCYAKPNKTNHAVHVEDPIPERCPYKFEQMVFAGMKND